MAIGEFFDPGGPLMIAALNVLIQVTILCALALLAARCVRHFPAAKWWMLGTALCLSAACPWIVAASMRGHWGWVTLSSSVNDPSISKTVSNDVGPIPVHQIYGSNNQSEAPAPRITPNTQKAPKADISETVASPSISPIGNNSGATAWQSICQIVVAIWALGAALFGSRMLLGWLKLLAIQRRAVAIDDPSVQAVLRDVCAVLGVAQIPRLLRSARICCPLAAGVWRPAVIFPNGLLDELNDRELHDVLTHEVAHLRRRDQIIVLFQNLIGVAYWIHPLVAAVNRRFSRAREELCDNHVVSASSATAYSRNLLRLAELTQQRKAPLASVGFSTSDWKLESRVAGLLSDHRSYATRLSGRATMMLGVLAPVMALIIAAATVSSGDRASAGAATTGFNDKQPTLRSSKANVDKTYHFAGKVLTPDGRPAAGARLYFAVRKAKLLAETGADGTFEFTRTSRRLPSPRWGVRKIVVAKKGYGMTFARAFHFEVSGAALADWKERNPNRSPPKKKVPGRFFKLTKDDVPIRGRLIDLEGQPVAGATIQLRFVNKVYARFAFPAVKTNAGGEFEIRGVGPGRTVRLVAKGEQTAFSVFFARTEHGKTIFKNERDVGDPFGEMVSRGIQRVIYDARPIHAVPPSVPVQGVVTDADTGKPIPGVTIYAVRLPRNPEIGRREEFNVVTDDQGRYRLLGLPIGRSHLLAIRDGAKPYLPAGISVITKIGSPPLARSFSLKRGIWAEGVVVDDQTGQPLRGRVTYAAMVDNPHLKNAQGFSAAMALNLYRTNGAGRYRLPVLPGPGVVAVDVGLPMYPRGIRMGKPSDDDIWGQGALKTRPSIIFPNNENVTAFINPDVADKEVRVDMRLTAGGVVKVRIVDPDGMPLRGVTVIDFTKVNRSIHRDMKKLAGSEVVLQGYRTDRPRKILAWHSDRNLAGRLILRGEPADDLVLTLRPAGAMQGRVVDAAGRPQSIRLLTDFGATLESGVVPGPGQMVPISVDGKFELRYLVPGVSYRLDAMSQKNFVYLGRVLNQQTASAGETRNLGDVQIQKGEQ